MRNGRTRLNLHQGQTTAWDSTARFVFVIAGTQSGKTSFGPWLFHKWIQEGGPGDYLAVTATYDLFKLKMLPEMLKVFCELTGWGKYRASDRVIESHDGRSRIILRSANAPGGLESATAKAAWLDEVGQDEFRLESWEAVLRRLSLAQGRVLGTTTPYNLGWLKTEIYDRWRAGDRDTQVIQFRSTMNPMFPQAEYERARATLAGWKFGMFYDGVFTRPAGLIYGDFDELTQIVEPFILPAEWPRWVGVDFGALHTALVWVAEDPVRKAYYVYRESLEGEMTTAQHAKKALAFVTNPFFAERVVGWFGGSAGEQQQRMDWGANGVKVLRPPIGDVEAGIDRVIELVKARRLFVFSSLRGLRDELGTYSREVDARGEPTEKIKDKETFHRLDALRYVVSGMTRLNTGGQGARSHSLVTG